MDEITRQAAQDTIECAAQKGVRIATAESCTGGLISAALTDINGSSSVFDRAFITYSNDAKHEMLGVPRNLLKCHGAVSGEVAQAMAQGALSGSNAALSVAVTGIAGPTGGTTEKPVGTVWFGYADHSGILSAECKLFPETNRQEVRRLTVLHALGILLSKIS